MKSQDWTSITLKERIPGNRKYPSVPKYVWGVELKWHPSFRRWALHTLWRWCEKWQTGSSGGWTSAGTGLVEKACLEQLQSWSCCLSYFKYIIIREEEAHFHRCRWWWWWWWTPGVFSFPSSSSARKPHVSAVHFSSGPHDHMSQRSLPWSRKMLLWSRFFFLHSKRPPTNCCYSCLCYQTWHSASVFTVAIMFPQLLRCSVNKILSEC